jgi:hypothetical protein
MKVRIWKTGDKVHRYFIQCPGCKEEHQFNDGWKFNGDMENPTFSPSLLVQGGRGFGDAYEDFRCHSFIRDGRIQFLNDCTHHLKGQTVDLPNYKL